jgi:hypothetical protein
MNRAMRAAFACVLVGSTTSLGQPGSLFDPENARIDGKPSRSNRSADAPNADVPTTAFPLTERCGPVLIRVASFTGDAKAQYAEALAKELRERHKLAAYVYRYQAVYTPEITDELAQKYKEQFGIAPRRYVPLTDPPANWTVLVGDFPSFEDRAAQKTLAYVRKLSITSVPEAVWRQERFSTLDQVDANEGAERYEREQFKDASKSMSEFFRQFRDVKVQTKGRLSAAMLVRNPHPNAPRAAKQISPQTAKLLLEMNTSTPYSVYENRGAYTLVVAQFQGGMDVGDQKNSRLFSGGKIADEDRSPLAQAAKQAISLCEALRQLGVDAYVFHGQYASLVCAGGFPERLDVDKEEFRDPRVRARWMSQTPEVNAYREKLAKITLGGVQLAPYAELIVTPRPPASAAGGLAN